MAGSAQTFKKLNALNLLVCRDVSTEKPLHSNKHKNKALYKFILLIFISRTPKQPQSQLAIFCAKGFIHTA
jgi:hypothetical protein